MNTCQFSGSAGDIDQIITVIIAAIPNRLLSYWWNHLISPINVTIAPMAPVSGHDLLFTMWN